MNSEVHTQIVDRPQLDAIRHEILGERRPTILATRKPVEVVRPTVAIIFGLKGKRTARLGG